MRLLQTMFLLFFAAVSAPLAAAPEFDFHAPASADDPAAGAAMRDLATRLVPVYQEDDPDRYLANLSALQMVAGNYAAAEVSRQSLRDRRRRSAPGRPVSRELIFDLYAHAKAMETENRVPFAEGFTKTFHDSVPALNDQDLFAVMQWLGTSPGVFRYALQKAFDQQRAQDSIGQPEAVALIWAYLYCGMPTAVSLPSLSRSMPRRNIGATRSRPMFRSRPPTERASPPWWCGPPAPWGRCRRCWNSRSMILRSTPGSARRTATWASWPTRAEFAPTPGKSFPFNATAMTPARSSTGLPSSLGATAASACTATATADLRLGQPQNIRRPRSRPLPPQEPAPGVDVPMGGNIFQNSAYRWSSYVTNTTASDESGYYDDALWRALDQKWYLSGRRYRDLGRLHGKPNPIFIRWLNHPSYDRYWQEMIPYREQFAHVSIPVLTVTGYYAGSEPGALYYFTQHHRYDPHANHTLIIGPYDDAVMQRGPLPVLQGYQVDSAALVDLHELRYQWFDHVLKAGPTPSLLAGRVNYEVMGANEWRHAASLETGTKSVLRFYLDAAASGDGHRLSLRKNSKPASVLQIVKLADRRDAGWTPSIDLISTSLASRHDVRFVSEPITKPIEFSGLFTVKLDFTVNKMDMDFNIMLFERLASGEYVRLFSPTDEIRASYARDRVHRHLLRAGERQELTFKAERMTSRQLQAGSRLVMVLGINKRADREINYGSGADVSEESVADGKIPLKIRWHNDSYIDIPIQQDATASRAYFRRWAGSAAPRGRWLFVRSRTPA